MNKKYYLYQMNAVALNAIACAIFIAMMALTCLIYRERGFTITDTDFTFVIAFMIPYLILHELLHSLSYVLHGADFKYITYGIHLEKGIMCCLCKENISKKNILISILYPFIWIGVVTYIAGVMLDSSVFILLSIINISGCAGDLMMFFGLSRVKNFEYSEYDNPMAFGLYSADDLSKLKLFGLKYVGEQEELERQDLKKVTISKISWAFMVLIVLMPILLK